MQDVEESAEAHQGNHENWNQGRDFGAVLVRQRLQQILEKEIGVKVLDLQTLMPIISHRPIAAL